MREVLILTDGRNTYSGGPTFAKYLVHNRRSVFAQRFRQFGSTPDVLVHMDFKFSSFRVRDKSGTTFEPWSAKV